MNLIKIITQRVNNDAEAKAAEEEVSEHLNNGWRVQSSHIFSTEDGWEVGFILIKHPHFAARG